MIEPFSYTIPIAVNYVGEKPTKGSLRASAYDLRAAEDFFLEGMHHLLVKTDTKVQIPDGCVGLVCSRSGLANNKGICVLNAPGVIDPDFVGPVGIILFNTTLVDYRGKKGERIAQLLIVPAFDNVSFIQKESLEQTERGEGAYGSTGLV